MNKPIKFIYFDIDDTILDHKSAERAALQDTRSEFDILLDIEIEKLWDAYHANNAQLWIDYGLGKIDRPSLERFRFERTLKDLGLPSAEYANIRYVYMEYYKRHWSWIEGAEKALEAISQRFPIGFLTNGFAELQNAKINQFKLKRFGKTYVISEEVGYMKPSPQIFEHATKLATVEPDEILYVGDSFISDIRGASLFGWHTAWFTQSPDPAKAKVSSFMFEDFQKLPALICNYIGK